MLERLKELAATCLYIGHLPGMPGTYASAATLAVFVLARTPLALAGWLVFLGMVVVSIFALSDLERTFGSSDPRQAVLDEAAGMWLTLLVGAAANLTLIITGFVLFRILDAAKPFPIRRLERLAGWRGVLSDDLAAGLIAGLVVRLFAAFVST